MDTLVNVEPSEIALCERILTSLVEDGDMGVGISRRSEALWVLRRSESRRDVIFGHLGWIRPGGD